MSGREDWRGFSCLAAHRALLFVALLATSLLATATVPTRGSAATEVFDGTPADGVLQGSDETAFVDGREVPVGGDVLLAIDDVAIRTSEDLGSYLALQTSPGQTVTLTVHRDGSTRSLSLELGERPPP